MTELSVRTRRLAETPPTPATEEAAPKAVALHSGSPPPGGVGASRAEKTEPSSEVDKKGTGGFESFFDNVDAIILLMKKLMSGQAASNRKIRGVLSKAELDNALASSAETRKQAEETMAAALKQAKGMEEGGIMKLVGAIIAMLVIAVVLAKFPGASMVGVTVAGMLMGGLMAGAEILQGQYAESAAHNSRAAAQHEAFKSDLQALGEKMKHRREQANQDEELAMQLLQDAQEIAKEVRDFLKQGSFG